MIEDEIWRSDFDHLGDDLDGMQTVSYNISPTQNVPLITYQHDEWRVAPARWWFVPDWFKEPAKNWKATTFNARIEEAANKPSYRKAWRQQRGLIPASGYYEWTGPKGAKIPFYIQSNRNRSFFFMAALYSQHDWGRSCAIITRPASAELSEIHSRMPFILNETEMLSWLQGGDVVGELDGFRAHQVARFSTRDQGVSLIEPMMRDWDQ